MPSTRSPQTDPGLTSLLAGLWALLHAAMDQLGRLGAGDAAGFLSLERLLDQIDAGIEDLFWRVACTMARRPDLLRVPKVLRKQIMAAAERGDIAFLATLNAGPRRPVVRRSRINPSPKARALMPLILRDLGRYQAAQQRRIRARISRAPFSRFAAGSVSLHAVRQPDPG